MVSQSLKKISGYYLCTKNNLKSYIFANFSRPLVIKNFNKYELEDEFKKTRQPFIKFNHPQQCSFQITK